MAYKTHMYCAENLWISNADQETTHQMTEATSKIQSLYDAGTLLFTKDAIRDVYHQLIRCKSREVLVTGLNGVKIGFRPPHTTLAPPGDDPETELILYIKFPILYNIDILEFYIKI